MKRLEHSEKSLGAGTKFQAFSLFPAFFESKASAFEIAQESRKQLGEAVDFVKVDNLVE